ncbi:MAG: hypothetical protein M4579_000954 [Chaenotheca gracillima]|nr:MAG: hypothetical protein M4579_000954 [Chaenotheca gracillima]
MQRSTPGASPTLDGNPFKSQVPARSSLAARVGNHARSSTVSSDDASWPQATSDVVGGGAGGGIEAGASPELGEERAGGRDLTPRGSVDRDATSEVDRLRKAMEAQINIHHRRLSKGQLSQQQAASSSPKAKGVTVPEESFDPEPATSRTTSTGSGKTIRGSALPTSTSTHPAATPSYPFPSMTTPKNFAMSFHKPFTTLSPTVGPETDSPTKGPGFPKDHPAGGSLTPSSAATFRPAGMTDPTSSMEYPTPNLYDVTLRLNSEPGLDAWWTTVVQVMREYFKADRLTLALPADTTDLENVPWGQKATFDVAEDDRVKSAYLHQRDNSSTALKSQIKPDVKEKSDTEARKSRQARHRRPKLEARHSFTSFEMKSADKAPKEESIQKSTRPGPVRTRSFVPVSSPREEEPVEEAPGQREEELPQPQRSEPDSIHNLLNPDAARLQGQVFPVLQAFEHEANPLIDSSGVSRVLQRGKIVLLSREYTAASSNPKEQADTSSKPKKDEGGGSTRKSRPSFPTHAASLKASSKISGSRSKTPRARAEGDTKETSSGHLGFHFDRSDSDSDLRYEEFEQFPTSPWSQSPAPSPAIRNDPEENPFFTTGSVDETSFSPKESPLDYTNQAPVEAIGFGNASTVIHIPLIHPLLSMPIQPARLESIAAQTENPPGSGFRDNFEGAEKSDYWGNSHIGKKMPIAILSILSPATPFPQNLHQSLVHLAPHLATSFSLARHCTNVEKEAAALARRRFRASDSLGHSLPAANGNSLEDLTSLDLQSGADDGQNASVSGSVTSPSDYSSISKGSPAGSLAATPNWDPTQFTDRRSFDMPGQSPIPDVMDNYFQLKQKHHSNRTESGPVLTLRNMGSRRPSTLHTTSDPRPTSGGSEVQDFASPSDRMGWPPSSSSKRQAETPTTLEGLLEESKSTPKARAAKSLQDASSASPQRENIASRKLQESLPSRRTASRNAQASQSASGPERRHTKLHSYGADFRATFQTLPTTSTPSPRNPAALKGHSRKPSEPNQDYMDLLPPSERLLRTIVDALPVQIFTAAPQTGVITWINSKFLTYRGITVEEVVKRPWDSVHENQRDDYMRAWNQSLRNGEPFSYQAELRRFDGIFRWFYVRAAPLRDTRGIIVHWIGSNMDIHEQHVAEVNAARQHETAASEAKYRSLANSSPQIVFAATSNSGVTFANTQWMSYSGQSSDEAIGFGFADHVHPDDLSKCKLPQFGEQSDTVLNVPTSLPSQTQPRSSTPGPIDSNLTSPTSTAKRPESVLSESTTTASEDSTMDMATSQLSGLAKTGILKATKDSDGKISYSTEVRLRSKSGDYRWHLVRCTMVDSINFGSGDGQWFGTCSDINDHKILEQKMKETMDSKTRFLSNMSHEIRTPLIGISGMIEFLTDTALTAEQMDYCSTIRSSSDGLLDIVNDILDLSKIEAGMMTLSFDWFHIRSMIESVNDAVSSVAIKKHLELNYVVEEDVPSMVKGDQARIRQVLMNVLGNAVKFTSTGEIFTLCQVHREVTESSGENNIVLSFEIVDSGQGFTQKEAELIFKPFSQIDGSSTRRHGGSGLGLVISRQLVELHGGKMTGTSEPGKGSVFKFFAKFSVPSEDDSPQPEIPRGSHSGPSIASSGKPSPRSPGKSPADLLLAKVLTQSPPIVGTSKDRDDEVATVNSSGSSDPSLRSSRTPISERSSISSVGRSLTPSVDPAKMKLSIPEHHERETSPSSSTSTATPQGFQDRGLRVAGSPFKTPPMYSVLVVCPHPYALKAITRHIEMTLPKSVPHQITSMMNLVECQRMIGGDDPVLFTHIVSNLGEPEEVTALLNQTFGSPAHSETELIILADAGMRNAIKRHGSEGDYLPFERTKHVRYLHKPVKPSRFADIFDPKKERMSSMDRNRNHAERVLETQKQMFVDMEKNVGNRGHKILLVEDNIVNQKVLRKFLDKIGMEVETVSDGVQCTDRVFKEDHGFFSLILCDLHMPNKDGYQTCKDIRRWERKEKYPHLPIIALSANVMADVVDKCAEAGFSDYVTKPVDFKALSKAMTEFLDPADPSKPHQLMGQNQHQHHHHHHHKQR